MCYMMGFGFVCIDETQKKRKKIMLIDVYHFMVHISIEINGQIIKKSSKGKKFLIFFLLFTSTNHWIRIVSTTLAKQTNTHITCLFGWFFCV